MKLWLHEKDTPESTVRHFLPNAAQEQLRHHPTIDLSDDADKADVGVRIYPFTRRMKLPFITGGTKQSVFWRPSSSVTMHRT